VKFPTTHPARSGGVLKVILIIVAVLVVMAIVGFGALIWWGKSVIDKAGGVEAFATQMVAKGVEMLEPELRKVLSEEDQKLLMQDIQALKEKAGTLTAAQLEEIGKAVQKISDQMQDGSVTPEEGKAFVTELTRILTQPAAAPAASAPDSAPSDATPAPAATP
jgi:uncharacterized protein YoxC